jgi:sterol desaturase/sphingolipid hydroxylase (fatty acid hydroxylase superfamily)
MAVGAGITLAVLVTDVLRLEHFWNWLEQVKTATAALPLVIQIVIAFVITDFLSYWIHRAYHRVPFLWSFHLMHHTSEQVDWLSTLRLHPISQMMDTALIAGLLLIAGLSLPAIIVANAIIGFSAVLTHANVPWTFGLLGRVFVSPVFHHWHHARHEPKGGLDSTANFGAALSIWDRIFGTSLHEAKRPARFGVDNAPPMTFWSLVFQPLRFCWHKLRTR